MRSFLLLGHRWLGLTLAGFLIVIGATGSVIAFFPELDRWANPGLLTVAPEGPQLDALALRERMAALDPRAHVYYLHFPDTGESFSAYVEGAIDPATGEAFDIGYDEVFADPHTGERLGKRMWGNFSLQRPDWFTQLYFLHYSLVLPEALGEGFMGIVALLWALDCLVAFGLTLPRRGKRLGADAATRRSWWTRWAPAWKLKLGAGTNRVVFDWHRASGLWLWPMLLVFAWSGFALNLPGVYQSVMQRIVHIEDIEHPPKLAEPLTEPAVGWHEALSLGERHMAQQAQQQGFEVLRPWALIYRRETGTWYYRVLSSRDVTRHGMTAVSIDASSGALRGVAIPTGHRAGDTFTSWIKALHMAMVFGMPMRIFVSACGLLVVALTVTGVMIWWRKRRMRSQAGTRRSGLRGEAIDAAGTALAAPSSASRPAQAKLNKPPAV